MSDTPLIVRVATTGPRLGSRSVTPAAFIPAEECEHAWVSAKWTVRTQGRPVIGAAAVAGERTGRG